MANFQPDLPEVRPFEPGSMDALAPFAEEDAVMLIQLDLITEELLGLAFENYPGLQLWKGTCSYHRLVTPEIYEDLLIKLGHDRCITLVDRFDYIPDLVVADRPEYYPDDCVNWGEDYYDTDGSILYGPDCIGVDEAICIGYYNGIGDAWGCAYYDCALDHSCDIIESWHHWQFRVKGDMCDATGDVQAFVVGSDGEWIYPGIYLPEDYGISELYTVGGNWQDWTPGCHLRIVIESSDNYDCEWVQFDWAYYYNDNPCDEDNGEPDDNHTQANEIEDGDSHYHTICPIGDEDWSYFDISGGYRDVVIETTGEEGDTELWLYNSNVVEIEYDDDGGSDYFSLIEATLSPGRYYTRVAEYGDDDPILLYHLNFDIEEDVGSAINPPRFSISRIYPNPFNPSTSIEYSIASPCEVEIRVYNINGQNVGEISEGLRQAGYYTTTWAPNNLPSGIYFVEMQAGDFRDLLKVSYLK